MTQWGSLPSSRTIGGCLVLASAWVPPGEACKHAAHSRHHRGGQGVEAAHKAAVGHNPAAAAAQQAG